MLTRRMLLSTAAAAPLAAAAAAVAGGGQANAALPECDMEAVVKAAQIDPRRADTTITPGCKANVLLVEHALVARGLLDSAYVDGHFGTKTIDAYAAWQRSLGFSGLDASGLPGQTSLKALGQNRFAVIKILSPGSRVTFRGVTVNTRTKAMLLAAEALLGRTLALTQGSYNPGGDPTSAGTHDGGGVVDISVDGMTSATRTNVAWQLRVVGFAAWVRNPTQGDWPWHIHAVALADTDQSAPAYHQSGDYYLGLNGLANREPDDGPVVTPKLTWEEYQRTL